MNSPNELSFLPDDYLAHKAQRRTNVICGSLFVVVMVAIGSAFRFTEQTVQGVEQQHAMVQRQYTVAAKRIELVQEMREKQRRMAHQAELTSTLLEKVPRSFILAEITNAMPTGVSLLDFSLESKKKIQTPAAGAKTAFEKKQAKQEAKAKGDSGDKTQLQRPPTLEVSLRITGMATTDVQVAAFINKLNQSRYLRDVNLVITDQFDHDAEKLRRFTIDALLDPGAEVSTDGKPTRTVSLEIKE